MLSMISLRHFDVFPHTRCRALECRKGEIKFPLRLALVQVKPGIPFPHIHKLQFVLHCLFFLHCHWILALVPLAHCQDQPHHKVLRDQSLLCAENISTK